MSPIKTGICPLPRTGLRRVATGLTLFSALALAGCGGGGGAGAPPPVSPPPVSPPSVPPPAPAPPSAGVAPAAVTSRSADGRTLQTQDGRATAGAQVSTSSRYTLISEGVSP